MEVFIEYSKKPLKKAILFVFFVIQIFTFSNVSYVFADTANDGPFITNVRVENVDNPNGTANILWDTDLPVQSAVVCGTYAKAPYFYSRDKDNFGYEWKTKLMKGLVTEHKVPLDGLTKGIHHCRVASRLNDGTKWVVSEEITFNVGVGDTNSVNPLIVESEKRKNEMNDDNGSTDSEVADGDKKEDVSVSGDDENNGDIEEKASVALFSLSDAFNSDVCNDNWSVWLLVLMAVLFAILWSKELMNSLSCSEALKRLYVLSLFGIVVFFIAISKNAFSWIIPVGIGTVSFIMATIADVLRKDDSNAEKRLLMTVKVLLVSFFVALVFALVMGWSCSVLPISVVIIILVIRYSLHKHNGKSSE